MEMVRVFLPITLCERLEMWSYDAQENDTNGVCSDSEFVIVTLSLRFTNVTVAETEFTFYNCSLVQQLSGRRP